MTDILVFLALAFACAVVGMFISAGVVVLLSAWHEADVRRAVRRHAELQAEAKGGGQ